MEKNAGSLNSGKATKMSELTEAQIAARDALILKWQAAKDTLASAKEIEMTIRKQLTAMCFEDSNVGTNRIDLGNGYKLKYVKKMAYSVDADKIEDVLEAIEKVGNEGPLLADRLVKVEYTPSVSEYKKLDVENPTQKQIKDLFDKVLTTKVGSPVLELEVPKG